MKIHVRAEQPEDHPTVSAVIREAFKGVEFTDHKEHLLVERLRDSAAFVPGLSLVAEHIGTGKIVGHILLSKVRIINERDAFPSLALAPVSVKPAFQGQGIGSQLILTSHEVAKSLGFTSVIVLGHENYYPAFGYKPADRYGIVLPFDVPAENCMVIALVEKGLEGVYGKVEYPETFFV